MPCYHAGRFNRRQIPDMETSQLKTRIADLTERTVALRGYL
jgi:hypothetical protein